MSIDTTEFQAGTASLRIDVPAAGYTGGAMQIATPQDLSRFDAVTFWAKSSVDNPFNVFGIGNNASSNVYQAEYNGVALTATWTQFTIPIPNAARLTAEDGLFHFAEGSEHGQAIRLCSPHSYSSLQSNILASSCTWPPPPTPPFLK